MTPIILGALLVGSFLATGSARSGPHDESAKNISGSLTPSTISPHTRIGRYTVEEWRERVDTFWGTGEATSEKLRIFDLAWNELDREYGAYMNLDVDMEALRNEYRQEISEGVSKGRFAAIMNHLSLAMKDAHTVIMSRSVNWDTSMRSRHTAVRRRRLDQQRGVRRLPHPYARRLAAGL